MENHMKNKASVFYYFLLMLALIAIWQPSFAQKNNESESIDSLSAPPAEYQIETIIQIPS